MVVIRPSFTGPDAIRWNALHLRWIVESNNFIQVWLAFVCFLSLVMRPKSQRSRRNDVLGIREYQSFVRSDRTGGARRVWNGVQEQDQSSGLHRIDRLIRGTPPSQSRGILPKQPSRVSFIRLRERLTII